MSIETIFTGALIVVLPFAFFMLVSVFVGGTERQYNTGLWIAMHVSPMKFCIVAFSVCVAVACTGWVLAGTLVGVSAIVLSVFWALIVKKYEVLAG